MNIRLDVPQILQNPELPNGCEITSLCQVLRFYGFDADKCDLADHYLPRSERWWGADPDLVYLGDPHREDDTPFCGFYCFTGPILQAASAWLSAHGAASRYVPTDLSGAEEAELIAQLEAGRPFIFWASLHFEDILFDPRGSFPLPDGREHRLFHHLHCMVCSGVDDENFYVTDPLDFNCQVPRAQFMKIYRQLGRRALVLVPEGQD